MKITHIRKDICYDTPILVAYIEKEGQSFTVGVAIQKNKVARYPSTVNFDILRVYDAMDEYLAANP